MTTRRSLTRAQKVRVFDRHKGVCFRCGLKIHAGRGEEWEVGHVKSLWKKGADILENMRPVHKRTCHRKMTDEEATERAKEAAIRANYLGIPKPGPKLPAGRRSDVKKKISGEVVSRPERGSEHSRVMEAFPNRRGE